MIVDLLDIQTGPVLGYDTLTNVRKTNPGQTSQKPPDDTVSNNLATQPEKQPGDTARKQPGDTASNKPGDTARKQPGDTASNKPGDTARKTTRTRPGGLAAHNGLEATFTENQR